MEFGFTRFFNDKGKNLLVRLNHCKADNMLDLQSCSDSSYISESGQSIPLTSRRETLWFVASLRTEGWAARQPPEERSPSRLCVNFWESDSTPWLRYHTSRKNKQTYNPSAKTTWVYHLFPRTLLLGHCTFRWCVTGGLGSFCSCVRQRSPACGPSSESSADGSGSALLSSAQCACQRTGFILL